MQYQEFLGQVQHRARLATLEQATTATRATLETLGERLFGGEAGNLASQLPPELGRFLLESPGTERFDLDGFYRRVSWKEGEDLPTSIFHARAVMSVLRDAISPSLMDKVMDQLPAEYDQLIQEEGQGERRVA